MPAIITEEQFTQLTDLRFHEIFENRFKPKIQGIKEALFGAKTVDTPFYETWSIGNTPDPTRFNGAYTFVSRAPGYYNKIEPQEYGSGIIVEKKLIRDDQFGKADQMYKGLADAMRRFVDKTATNIFIKAFSNAFDYQTSEEGVALCSSGHLTKSGVSTSVGFSNYGTSALSKTSILATRIAQMRLRDDIGELIDGIMPDELYVPLTLLPNALEATGYDPSTGAESLLDPDSANHKINTAYGIKVIPLIRMDDYSTKNWFMGDSRMRKDMLHWVDRDKPEDNMETHWDHLARAVIHTIYARFGYGFTQWQWVYGNQVS